MTVLPGPPMVTHCALVVALLGTMVALLGAMVTLPGATMVALLGAAMVALLAAMVTLLNFPKHVTPLLHDPFKWQPHFDT